MRRRQEHRKFRLGVRTKFHSEVVSDQAPADAVQSPSWEKFWTQPDRVCLPQWALLCVKGWARPPEVLSKWSYSAILWLQLKFHRTQVNRALSGATIENPETDLTQNLRDLNRKKKNIANYFYCKLCSSIFINFWKFNFVSFLCFVDSIKFHNILWWQHDLIGTRLSEKIIQSGKSIANYGHNKISGIDRTE